VVCKVVDDIMEPCWRRAGMNAYEAGLNLATANLTYITGPSFYGEDLFVRFLAAAQRFLQTPAEETFHRLFGILAVAAEARPADEHPYPLEMVLHCLDDLRPADLESPVPRLNLALPMALEMMAGWAES